MVFALLSSCASKKEIIYLQDIDNYNLENVTELKQKTIIQINDILKIDIMTLNPESVIPYLKEAPSSNSSGGQQLGLIKLQGYIVDENGEIEMAIIGKVKVKGLSREDAEQEIKSKLSQYLKDPFVSVRIVNYKFTIQGEVNNPGTYEITEPNFTLFQALGMAGDLNIRGKRDNILIIRTQGDERIVKRIDLTQSDWMNTPFYFIKQNDVIIVEPNNPQVKTAGFIGNVGILTSVASILLSAVVIITR
mgnify:CR=1 FL=1